ncbi:hypothetical protein HMPREF3231_02181 [Bifidobacterium longum]|nr:hypothetical protein HMPREF3231_02181 [Bifidobacterium longum]
MCANRTNYMPVDGQHADFEHGKSNVRCSSQMLDFRMLPLF